ncbi:DUF6702 family protein [Simiduia agarivorans]|uniref:Orphan protein n=2 Tax=Simiduia TaxID=447467 RepID=K4L3Z5_SIMAS|nr:hypothetical protein M5M_19045 [Simiduia agarivorans SA1 = DSM 21679]
MIRGVLLLVCALWACVGQAHQMKAAMTKVLFNARTGNVEVMHRFYVHDAEHALSQIAGKQVHLLDDAAAQQQFGRYVASHFAMGYAREQAQSFSYVGQELEGKFIWVYQELPVPDAAPAQLWFRHTALQDFWPEQMNQINVEGLGPVRSLQLTRESGWQSLQY